MEVREMRNSLKDIVGQVRGRHRNHRHRLA
jgi:hypothetical protein